MLVSSFYSNVLLQCAFNQLIKAAFWISSIGKLIEAEVITPQAVFPYRFQRGEAKSEELYDLTLSDDTTYNS
jgi:hypothetical protein